MALAVAVSFTFLLLAGAAARLSATGAQAATTIPLPSPTTAAQAAVIVTGSATIDVIPDVARLVVSIQTTAPTASQAESQNAAAADSAMSHIERAGIASVDIKTLGMQVWPQYDYRSSPQVLTGFTATQTLQVTIRNLSRIGAVIDAAVAGGATSVQGITYDITDHSAASAQALAKAVADAQVKARAMANAAGIRLGPVVSITDIESTPYPFPIIRAATASAGSSGTQVSPPDVQLTVSVTVGWSIA
ncbi:MAG TPA: SIMPL domain-containing protein [Candidatus Dormibacteraeota bacterium]